VGRVRSTARTDRRSWPATSRRPSWTGPRHRLLTQSRPASSASSRSSLNFSTRRPSPASVPPRLGHDELAAAWPTCRPHLLRSSCRTRCCLLKASCWRRGLIEQIDVLLFLPQSLLFLVFAATGQASDRSRRGRGLSNPYSFSSWLRVSDQSGRGYLYDASMDRVPDGLCIRVWPEPTMISLD
jgi:hypothetical protein